MEPDSLGLIAPEIESLIEEKYESSAVFVDTYCKVPEGLSGIEYLKWRDRKVHNIAIAEAIADNNRRIREQLEEAGILPPLKSS